MTKPAANPHKVPLRQWRKWDELARGVFNDTFETMVGSQNLFLHPRQDGPRAEYWKTTAWNAAWIAAEAVRIRAKAVK